MKTYGERLSRIANEKASRRHPSCADSSKNKSVKLNRVSIQVPVRTNVRTGILLERAVMDYFQLDMFGNEVPLEDVAQHGQKRLTMQDVNGTLEGKSCFRCAHCVEYPSKSGKRIRHKCDIWTCSPDATVRRKSVACRKFVARFD